MTAAFAVAQGGTPYYITTSCKWMARRLESPPSGSLRILTAGIASSINVYQYTIIKTGSATFTVPLPCRALF